MRNLSCENEFYLHYDKKSFSYQRFFAQFWGNSDMAYFEGLNGVNRQKSNGPKFNREPSKKLTFYHQPSKKQINTNCQKVSTVGTSNLTFSADPKSI